MQCTFPCFLNLKIRKETNYEAYQGEADSSLAVLGKKKLTHIFVTVGLKELKSMSTPNKSFIAEISNIVNLDIIY